MLGTALHTCCPDVTAHNPDVVSRERAPSLDGTSPTETDPKGEDEEEKRRRHARHGARTPRSPGFAGCPGRDRKIGWGRLSWHWECTLSQLGHRGGVAPARLGFDELRKMVCRSFFPLSRPLEPGTCPVRLMEVANNEAVLWQGLFAPCKAARDDRYS